jgi:hypothetical protein
MRKPTVINLDECGSLRRTVLATARTLKHDGKIIFMKDGNLCGLKGDVTSLAREITEASRLASIELFGAESYDEAELKGIQYLRSL